MLERVGTRRAECVSELALTAQRSPRPPRAKSPAPANRARPFRVRSVCRHSRRSCAESPADRVHAGSHPPSACSSEASSRPSCSILAGRTKSARCSLNDSLRFEAPRSGSLRRTFPAFFATGAGRAGQAVAALGDHVGITAGIFDPTSAALRDEHRSHDPIEKISVVADQQHRAGIVGQQLLQQIQRLDVEVVGRLVEHQQVGGAARARGPASAGRVRLPIACRSAFAPARAETGNLSYSRTRACARAPMVT